MQTPACGDLGAPPPPEPVAAELDPELEAVARYEECRMILGQSESLFNFLEKERDNPGSEEPGWAIVSSPEARLQRAQYSAELQQGYTSKSHKFRDAALTAMAGTNSNCACDGWCALPPSVVQHPSPP